MTEASLPAAEALRGSRAWRPTAAYWASAGLHGAALIGAVLQPTAWPWWAGLCVSNHAALAALSLAPGSSLLGPAVTELPPTADAVALTFDDGPDPLLTPKVLDLLDAHRARATFFCVGERVRAHPALVREVVARGHAVENHSMRHSTAHGFMLPGRLRREIADAQSAIVDATGSAPLFFRPPFGVRTPFTEPVLCALGLHCVAWSVRSLDAVDADAARVARRVTSALKPGAIILLHDGLASGRRIEPATVLRALPVILDAMRTRGLRSISLRSAFEGANAY